MRCRASRNSIATNLEAEKKMNKKEEEVSDEEQT